MVSMSLRRARIPALMLFSLLALAGSALRAEETVQFPGPDGLVLKGIWYPAKQTPAPAVILLHGCGGAYGHDGKLAARHAAMAEFLHQHGYAVLLPDSFTPRGLTEICTTKLRERTVKEADRAADAYAALDWLAKRGDVESAHIGLLGWSNGGGSTLKTIGLPPPADGPRFAAAVAFYPGCAGVAKARYQPSAPVLILTGEADDWTPIAPCRALLATHQPGDPPIELHAYPDTYHDFDNPALKAPRHRADVPNGTHPGQGITIAPNPNAARDAWSRTAAWLDQYLHTSPRKPD